MFNAVNVNDDGEGEWSSPQPLKHQTTFHKIRYYSWLHPRRKIALDKIWCLTCVMMLRFLLRIQPNQLPPPLRRQTEAGGHHLFQRPAADESLPAVSGPWVNSMTVPGQSGNFERLPGSERRHYASRCSVTTKANAHQQGTAPRRPRSAAETGESGLRHECRRDDSQQSRCPSHDCLQRTTFRCRMKHPSRKNSAAATPCRPAGLPEQRLVSFR